MSKEKNSYDENSVLEQIRTQKEIILGLKRKGDTEGASEILGDCYFNLGKLYEQRGNLSSAELMYKRAGECYDMFSRDSKKFKEASHNLSRVNGKLRPLERGLSVASVGFLLTGALLISSGITGNVILETNKLPNYSGIVFVGAGIFVYLFKKFRKYF
jgi:hypothetical protein